MKNPKSILAIIAMATLATAVAVVSCKKDTENALNPKAYNVQQSFDYRQIEDKSTYFKEFRQKMTDSKTDEAFNLEDAAWHLACLANIDFCKVNVEYNNIQFDTVEMQVNVTDGVVLLSDLGTAYEQMHEQILQFKKGFTHNDQNLYFINASINADGNAKVALMSTFTKSSKYIWDHAWYYEDEWAAINACDVFFGDERYLWDTVATHALDTALNLVEHHENDSTNPNHIMTCYLPTRIHVFDYSNTSSDPYLSGFYQESRVFAYGYQDANFSHYLECGEEICYCFDSYLELGYNFINDNLYANERPVCWKVFPNSKYVNYITKWIHYHQLQVNYGQLFSENPPGPQPG